MAAYLNWIKIFINLVKPLNLIVQYTLNIDTALYNSVLTHLSILGNFIQTKFPIEKECILIKKETRLYKLKCVENI